MPSGFFVARPSEEGFVIRFIPSNEIERAFEDVLFIAA